ncbi:MAG: hypothetical protein WDL87_03770 [Candidatus Omnitrophota bacterium]|jgi:hypothetical protein
MKKFILVMAACCLLTGCATYYHVKVNGYLDSSWPQQHLRTGSSFCVLANKNARNPILETEIKSKIESLLIRQGYLIAAYEKADFYLSFMYTMSSGRVVSDFKPVFYPAEVGTIRTYDSEGKPSVSTVTYPGYTAYVPSRSTVYTSSLMLEVLDAGLLRNTKEEKKIWIGDVSYTGETADLRVVVNYLLAAVFGRFGENTGKMVAVDIKESELREKGIIQ